MDATLAEGPIRQSSQPGELGRSLSHVFFDAGVRWDEVSAALRVFEELGWECCRLRPEGSKEIIRGTVSLLPMLTRGSSPSSSIRPSLRAGPATSNAARPGCLLCPGRPREENVPGVLSRQQDGDCECPHSLDSPRGPFRLPMILLRSLFPALRFPFLSGCIFHAAFPAAWPPLGAAAQRIVARSQAAMRIAGRYRTRRYNRR